MGESVSIGSGLQGNVSAEVFDASTLTSQGVLNIENMSANLLFNQVGSWSTMVPYTDALWNLLQDMLADQGFIVWFNWGGQFKFGGKCEIPAYQNSVPGVNSAAVFTVGEQIVLSGATLEAIVANRLAFPAPTLAWGSQTYAASDVQSAVPCETAIKHFVTANLGPSAAVARRFPLLAVASNLARGGTVSYTVKFAANVDLGLMDIIRSLIATGGPLGVSVMLDEGGGGITFDVFEPNDLSGTAYFSKRLGNLTSVGLQIEDPTLTDACVLGQVTPILVTGTGAGNPWTKIETLVDQSSSTDATQNTQSGNDAIASGIASPTLSMSAQDLPQLEFGTDYYLGDKVTVEVADGDQYSDIVSQVQLMLDGSQSPPVSVTPTIGVPADAGNTTTSLTNQLTKRVRKIERALSSRVGTT
jgi:hypothetical protein